jgi:hypothetical protein
VTLTHSADCHDPVCPELHESPWYSVLLPLEGDALSLLTPGSDYRVGEIRIHMEPSGVEGERPRETSVVRFDPVERVPRESVNADLLGRAIREHREALFDPHAMISMTHLCFDDCAENIAARYDELASR